MNALLNYATVSGLGCSPATGLRTDRFTDASAVYNFNQIPMGNFCSTDSLFNSVPFAGNVAALPSTQASSLEAAVKKGIITEEEMKKALRSQLGFPTGDDASSEVETSTVNKFGALSGKSLEKARKSSKGSYAVTAEHKQMADKAVKKLKEALTSPSVSEAQLQEIEGAMEEIQDNPMMAEAFLAKANKTNFGRNGKEMSFYEAYGQALTKKIGKKAADERIKELKESFEETVSNRNSDVTDDAEYDSNKVLDFKGRLMKNASEHKLAAGIAGGTALVTAVKVAKFAPGVTKFVALTAVAAGALAYSGYNLLKD